MNSKKRQNAKQYDASILYALTGAVVIVMLVAQTGVSFAEEPPNFSVGKLGSIVYDGTPQQPRLEVTSGGRLLERKVDYVTSWRNNVNAGTARVTVSGRGKYHGKVVLEFEILPARSDSVEVSGIQPSYAYSGKPIEPKPRICIGSKELHEGIDYDLLYDYPVSGDAKVRIVFKRNINGMKTVPFGITGKAKPSTESTKSQTGSSSKTPASSSSSASSRKATSSSVPSKKEAQAKKIAISRASATFEKATYSGHAKTPAVTVKLGSATLKRGTDFKVKYADNVDAGKGKATITGIGKYKGSITRTFTIGRADIRNAKVKAIKDRYTTALSPIKPKPSASYKGQNLVCGKDYTLAYKNNVKPGKATVKLKGKGNFAYTKSVEFNLVNLGDDLARTACRLSYTQPTAYLGGKSGWHRGKAYKGTDAYLSAYARYRDAYKVVPKSIRYCAQYCSTGIGVIVCASGYAPRFPVGFWEQDKYLDFTSARVGTTYHGWTCVADYDKGNIPYSKLQPGDVLKDYSNHIWMYVGKKIPGEVYRASHGTKGTEADVGEPNGVWVSAHGGWWHHPGTGSASAPSIGDTSFAFAHAFKDVKVFRCTKPAKDAYRAGNVVA